MKQNICGYRIEDEGLRLFLIKNKEDFQELIAQLENATIKEEFDGLVKKLKSIQTRLKEDKMDFDKELYNLQKQRNQELASSDNFGLLHPVFIRSYEKHTRDSTFESLLKEKLPLEDAVDPLHYLLINNDAEFERAVLEYMSQVQSHIGDLKGIKKVSAMVIEAAQATQESLNGLVDMKLIPEMFPWPQGQHKFAAQRISELNKLVRDGFTAANSLLEAMKPYVDVEEFSEQKEIFVPKSASEQLLSYDPKKFYQYLDRVKIHCIKLQGGNKEYNQKEELSKLIRAKKLLLSLDHIIENLDQLELPDETKRFYSDPNINIKELFTTTQFRVDQTLEILYKNRLREIYSPVLGGEITYFSIVLNQYEFLSGNRPPFVYEQVSPEVEDISLDILYALHMKDIIVMDKVEEKLHNTHLSGNIRVKQNNGNNKEENTTFNMVLLEIIKPLQSTL